jgi:ABC-type nitrate/sulfonate/bicarbonate transport system permease component
MRISATVSILILIAAEMTGVNRGLEYALYFYQTNFNTGNVRPHHCHGDSRYHPQL